MIFRIVSYMFISVCVKNLLCGIFFKVLSEKKL